MNNDAKNRIVEFTEEVVSGKDFNEEEIQKELNFIKYSDHNFNVYKGILFIYHFSKFRSIPEENMRDIKNNNFFLKCFSFLEGNALSEKQVGDLFYEIISLDDNYNETREILLGSFFGAFWPFMNNPKNINCATNYGVKILEKAFSLDSFNIKDKIKLNKNFKVVGISGSGKKKISLLNLSSMVSVVLATVGKKIDENIIVQKTISRATSSVSGSSDVFDLLGVNLDLSTDDMIKISRKTKLGVFDLNRIVPKLNHVYDKRLFNVQIFAGLVGGSAIANPVDVNLINYGLTRGSNKLCLSILSKIYRDKNIIVLQGNDSCSKGNAMDQVSISSSTRIASRINGKDNFYNLTPSDFGLNYGSLDSIISENGKTENVIQFIGLLLGKAKQDIKHVVSMEVSLNLLALGVVDNLKLGSKLSLEAINSGESIEVLKDLINYSGGDMRKLDSFLKYLN